MEKGDVFERFSFLEEKGHIISFVGAGGKTTWMYRMAEYYSARGYRVLVTTTTHICIPEGNGWVKSLEEAENKWNKGEYVVVGEEAPNGKLSSMERKKLQSYMKKAEVVLVEADGAKRMPCKVPADHEPVLLPKSDIVVGIMGMDSLGKSLKEICFRVDDAERLLGKLREEILTEEDMIEILSSDRGTRKNVGSRQYCVILNKCNDKQRKQAAKRIAERLREKGVLEVAIG